MRHWASGIAAAALALAGQASARDLPVPAGKGWQHAATGLILTATLDGLPRTRLTDATQSEHDVMAEFATANQSDVATLYLFHPAIDDVAMWFDRSQTALENRSVFGDVAPSSADPLPFAPPGSTTPSALRRIYAPAKGGYRSTGLAVLPLGEWLVAIRLSSTTMAPRDLDGRLTRVIAAVRWPAHVAPSPVATMIGACPAPLVFRKAKVVETDGTDMLMTLLGASVVADRKASGKAETPVRWCRDPASTPAYGVYRDLDHDSGYALALQDAGRVMHVVPSLDAQMGKGKGYTVSLTDVDGTTGSYPSFDGLPKPDQVIALLSDSRRASARGKTITIDVKALP